MGRNRENTETDGNSLLSDVYDVYDTQRFVADENDENNLQCSIPKHYNNPLDREYKNQYQEESNGTLEKISQGQTVTTSYASYRTAKNRLKIFSMMNQTCHIHPPPEHSLDQSPCYPIITKRGEFYYCKLHPKVSNIHLHSD